MSWFDLINVSLGTTETKGISDGWQSKYVCMHACILFYSLTASLASFPYFFFPLSVCLSRSLARSHTLSPRYLSLHKSKLIQTLCETAFLKEPHFERLVDGVCVCVCVCVCVLYNSSTGRWLITDLKYWFYTVIYRHIHMYWHIYIYIRARTHTPICISCTYQYMFVCRRARERTRARAQIC